MTNELSSLQVLFGGLAILAAENKTAVDPWLCVAGFPRFCVSVGWSILINNVRWF